MLWQHDQISGVVDWVETSWGPAWLDVSHAATYLAMLHDADAATRFMTACRRRSGGPIDEDRYWTVMDIVGYLPTPAKVATPWRDCGLDISDTLAQRRLEEWLTQVLA
ncbi:hypothetical protein Ade02nite_96090 [Paractinoplanes deccanensis]|uniref:Aminoglycoside phosphotransferase n=1 Tax=Paractinoplanes deccanensis TaxID=113561 RepID=A0ABQ3YLT4_9ACTN|nr:hypothetical protein Ade02nite_96090 [Actinoplanes deccanensis]